MKDDKFIEDFTNTFDKASLNYENVLVLGDLNYNMQDGVYIPPHISHFLSLKFISVNIDSISLHSSVTFLSHARPDLAYSSIPPPCDDLSALHR
jgi:exonuclease III